MKKSNENILYGLLKANFSQADNDDMVVRKRSCLNAIVICRMLARLLLSDLFDICERIRAARRSAELAKNEGVVFLMAPALLKRMRDERDKAERWVSHLAEIMFGLLKLWQKTAQHSRSFATFATADQTMCAPSYSTQRMPLHSRNWRSSTTSTIGIPDPDSSKTMLTPLLPIWQKSVFYIRYSTNRRQERRRTMLYKRFFRKFGETPIQQL